MSLQMLFLLMALKKNNSPFDLDNYQFPIGLFFFVCVFLEVLQSFNTKEDKRQ